MRTRIGRGKMQHKENVVIRSENDVEGEEEIEPERRDGIREVKLVVTKPKIDPEKDRTS